MDYARIVRAEAALDSVDTFLNRVRTELAADTRPEVIDELLGAASNEILFIRVNLLETLTLDQENDKMEVT